MAVVLVALTGAFVALYLTMYKLGYIGTLVCAVGSCEKVQTSKWATFLGFPVGAWGVAYYVAVAVLGLVGLRAALAESVFLSRSLTFITGAGLVFSIWLTYLELFVIHAICQWCVISAVLATALFVICVVDLREVRIGAADLAADAADSRAGQGSGSTL